MKIKASTNAGLLLDAGEALKRVKGKLGALKGASSRA